MSFFEHLKKKKSTQNTTCPTFVGKMLKQWINRTNWAKANSRLKEQISRSSQNSKDRLGNIRNGSGVAPGRSSMEESIMSDEREALWPFTSSALSTVDDVNWGACKHWQWKDGDQWEFFFRPDVHSGYNGDQMYKLIQEKGANSKEERLMQWEMVFQIGPSSIAWTLHRCCRSWVGMGCYGVYGLWRSQALINQCCQKRDYAYVVHQNWDCERLMKIWLVQYRYTVLE